MQYDNISEVYDKFNDDFDYEKYLNAVFRRFALRKEGLSSIAVAARAF